MNTSDDSDGYDLHSPEMLFYDSIFEDVDEIIEVKKVLEEIGARDLNLYKDMMAKL